jgi:hypothetical protein
MAMVMMAMTLCRAGHFFNGNNAPMRLLAAHMLKLNGAMANVVVVLKNVVQLQQNARAL